MQDEERDLSAELLDVADLGFSLELADHPMPPTQVARTACRLVAIDPVASGVGVEDLREPFIRLAENLFVPGRMSATVRIGVRREEHRDWVESDLVVVAFGDSDAGRELAAASSLIQSTFARSPFRVDFRPLAELGWPKRGHAVYVRQSTLESPDGAELPLRFTWPGKDAPQRLLDALNACGPGTDLFVSITPTRLHVDEEESLRSRVPAAPFRSSVDTRSAFSAADERSAAVAIDLGLSFRTDLYALQILVVTADSPAAVALNAIGSAFTAPFDATRQHGFRVVSRPNALIGGGFSIDPVRDPGAVLARINEGLPEIGTGATREMVDLATSTEVACCFSWVTDADGQLPGVGRTSAGAPDVAAGEGTVELGLDVAGHVVRLPGPDRHLHLAFIGATGSGKSTLLVDLALQDAEAGRGILVIDPHGDMCRRILAALPESRRGDVRFLDALDGSGDGIDLLHLFPAGSAEQSAVNAALRDGMAADMNRDFSGPVFDREMSCLLDFTSIAGKGLDACERVAHDEEFRAALIEAIPEVPDRLVEWHKRFTKWLNTVNGESWLLSKMEWVRQGGTEQAFASGRPTMDLSSCLDTGKILLVTTGSDYRNAARTMSCFLSVVLICLNKRSQDSPTLAIYLDEFQRYSGDVSRRLLNEARKRSVALHLATQNLSNLDDHIESVLGNVGTLLIGRSQSQTASVAQRYLDIEPRVLAALPNLHAIARLTVAGQPSPPFELCIAPPSGPAAVDMPDWVMETLEARVARAEIAEAMGYLAQARGRPS